MVDPAAAGALLPAPSYPENDLPLIFSDGVTTILPNPKVMKMYLARVDGNYIVTEPNRAVVVAQVVMPTDVFIQTAQFFQNIIQNMIDQGTLSADEVARLREAAGGRNPPKNVG